MCVPEIPNEMDYAYDGYNNVTTEETYDWGPVGNRGPRIRRVTRTFLTSSAYTDKHIFDRLSSETVADGSNVAGAKTEYFYDDYSQFSLTARSGTIPGWTDPASNTRALLTSVRRYRDASNFVTEQLKYDVLGNLIEKVDALQHSTPIDFSDNFCTLVSGTCTNTSSHNSFAFPTRVTNALNQYTTTKYNFDTGLPVVTADLRGFETRTTYDLLNRTTSLPSPTENKRRTRTTM